MSEITRVYLLYNGIASLTLAIALAACFLDRSAWPFGCWLGGMLAAIALYAKYEYLEQKEKGDKTNGHNH